MGCAESRISSRVDVRDLEGTVRTGDLVLFSSKHAGAQVTKFFTASMWDHCGIVVKFSPRHVYILEYAGGVYLYPLFTRLYTYFAIQGRRISLRRLVPGDGDCEVMQKQVEGFVRSVLGQRPPSIRELVMATLKQEGLLTGFVAKLRGSEGVAVKDDLETLFCSKLIAAVYKHIGLLAPSRASSDFLPKHFSTQYDEYLDLQNGALLGPELPINFESVASEVEALQAQQAEEERRHSSPEAVLRAVSDIYLSAVDGLGSGFSGLGANISNSFWRLERGLHGFSDQAERALSQAGGAKLDDASLTAAASSSNDDETATGFSAAPTTQISSPAHGQPPTPAGAASASGQNPASSGGVQLVGGELVASVYDVDDGGMYSPSKGGGPGGQQAQGRAVREPLLPVAGGRRQPDFSDQPGDQHV